ncbi:MAG: glycosyltransferase family 2 protein [Clostridiales bacterium]|nr:glycosyltransferase family 2 protein [Clostridiales bacterium]
MLVSFVIPCYRSQKTLRLVVEEISETMNHDDRYGYEIILVNDSSPDETLSTIKELCVDRPEITGIDLAKNFGQHAALMAGMGFAKGDIIVCLDDDGQTPASEVHKLLDRINEGYDVVYAKYTKKMHSGIRNVGSRLNSLMTEKLLNKPKELYISSYFAAKRFIVDEILKYKHSYPYVIGLVLRTTNKICNVEVNHRPRFEGDSSYTFRKLINLWVNGFTAFSVKPLRISTCAGGFVAVVGFIYALYVVINKIINPLAPIGWSSTIAVILIIGGSILFVLGMIGEYVGRIYICMNNSPQYVIRHVYNSDIGLNNTDLGDRDQSEDEDCRSELRGSL